MTAFLTSTLYVALIAWTRNRKMYNRNLLKRRVRIWRGGEVLEVDEAAREAMIKQ